MWVLSWLYGLYRVIGIIWSKILDLLDVVCIICEFFIKGFGWLCWIGGFLGVGIFKGLFFLMVLWSNLLCSLV